MYRNRISKSRYLTTVSVMFWLLLLTEEDLHWQLFYTFIKKNIFIFVNLITYFFLFDEMSIINLRALKRYDFFSNR